MKHLETIKIYNNIPQSFIDAVIDKFSNRFNVQVSSVDDFDIDTYKIEIIHYEFLPNVYNKENTFYYLYIDSSDPIPALENTFNFQPFINYKNFSMKGTEELFTKSLDKIIKKLKITATSNTYTILECD